MGQAAAIEIPPPASAPVQLAAGAPSAPTGIKYVDVDVQGPRGIAGYCASLVVEHPGATPSLFTVLIQGVGSQVAVGGPYAPACVFQTDADGAAVVRCTDVAGADLSAFLVVEPVAVVGDTVRGGTTAGVNTGLEGV